MQDEDDAPTPTWDRLPEDVADALTGVLDNGGMPSRALALYARWWQLETWLRSLAYVELRSNHGLQWRKSLDQMAVKRQERDAPFEYMASPDWQDPLAYLDASKLFTVIDDNWDLFEPVMIARETWTGRRAEILGIRNRIGHLRRPHRDDLVKLEQLLRDLEHGAYRATTAYNRMYPAHRLSGRSSVLQAFRDDRLIDSPGLIGHASHQYDFNVRLSFTVRPWARVDWNRAINPRTPGVLWNMGVYSGRHPFNLRRLWEDFSPLTRQSILHLLITDTNSFEVTFPAVDEPKIINVALGDVLQAAFSSAMAPHHNQFESYPLGGGHMNLDSRIQVNTPWAFIDDSIKAISIFAAGGSYKLA